jgi:branched-chain amino acid aminotransferase
MAKMYDNVYYGNKLIDSKDAKISIASSAVLYGLSVYTVFPVSVNNDDRLVFRLDDHYQRLIDSARIVGIDTFEQNWSYEKFIKAVKHVLEANKLKSDVYVRATVHVDAELAGTRSRGLSTTLSMFIYDAIPILKSEGSRVKTSVWRRIPDYAIPSRAKVNGAYVNSVLAKQDALDSGYDDCIFLDVDGHVCELSAANVFIVRHGKLITPDTTSDLLEGINRRTVIEIARNELGLEVIERSIDLTELYIADEIFASGTSANVAPIVEVDARLVNNGRPGKITKQLQKIHTEIRNGSTNNLKHKVWLTNLK